ncbi:MAG: DUF3332 domain-containing protein [Pseudoflavonifractor sp.]|nr:DUF3332 domain-containing protein [Alloprevotella sp.]MCM1115955.1 DUF3332 domain-containing protein [Pseudoflavonifractor sp.]
MRKIYRPVAIIMAALMLGGSLSSCIGSFALTNKLLTWNRHIDSKFVNELVFVAFWILPVYEVSGLADLLVINSIEFWSGNNPVTASTRTVTGTDGERYLVETDATGYSITTLASGEKVRLEYIASDDAWDFIGLSGTRTRLMTYVDDSHIALPTADGRQAIVEVSAEGVMAYRAQASSGAFAQAE